MKPISDIRSRNGTLDEPPAERQREVLNQWRRIATYTGGERITELGDPDDPVAHRSLDAAGDALGLGRLQEGLDKILRLVVRDYRHSREAAFARQVIGQIRTQVDYGR